MADASAKEGNEEDDNNQAARLKAKINAYKSLIESKKAASSSSFDAEAYSRRSRKRANNGKDNKTKSSNEYCKNFNLTGQCKYETSCKYIHDSRQIAVCREFIKSGTCTKSNCTLSHQLNQDKMPACIQFQNGGCHREKCPYRHVKVSRQAEVCKEFLHGYCRLGDSCKLRHEYKKPRTSLKKVQVRSLNISKAASLVSQSSASKIPKAESAPAPLPVDSCSKVIPSLEPASSSSSNDLLSPKLSIVPNFFKSFEDIEEEK